MKAHLVGGEVAQVQRAVDWHSLHQRGVEEMAKLCHQAAPLILPSVVREEAVQRGVERVSDLYLRPQSVDDVTARARLRVEDGSGQWADRAPRPGQGVVILHLHTVRRYVSILWYAIEQKLI